MPSVKATLLREQLRLLKPILSRLPISADRLGQDKIGELGARVLAPKVNFQVVDFDAFKAALITPQNLTESGIVLYLHGGGYTAGTLRYACGFGSVLAARLSCPVFCPAYRLAPEDPFPAAIDDALEAYRYLLSKGYREQDITLIGESAGGGLVFALCHLLKEKQLSLPSKIVSLSPWSDLTLSGESYEKNEKLDPTLSKGQLSYYAELYAGDDRGNPLVSPVFGSFEEFPPARIFVGTDEILLSDSLAVKERYDAAERPCTLTVEEGMWHVYPIFSTPEAEAALQKIELFVTGKETIQKQEDECNEQGT